MKIITKCTIYAVSNVCNVICYFDGPCGKHYITLAIRPYCCPQQFLQNHGFVFGFLIVQALKPGFGRCY